MAEQTPPTENQPSVSAIPTIVRTIQIVLSLIVGFGALFAATGYMVVLLSLSKYSDLTTYNIVPSQVLAAGAIPWLFSAIIIYFWKVQPLWNVEKQRNDQRSQEWSERKQAIEANKRANAKVAQAHQKAREAQTEVQQKQAKAELDKAQGEKDKARKDLKVIKDKMVKEFLGENVPVPADDIQWTIEYIQNEIYKRENRQTTAEAVGIGGWFLGIGIFLSLLYGAFFYDGTPRFLGGGLPETVILTFEPSVTPSALGIRMDTRYENRSVPLYLHAHLTDGILVRDSTSARMLSVENEIIGSILAEKGWWNTILAQIPSLAIPDSTEPVETYLPTATSTSTPTPTPTLIPQDAALTLYHAAETATATTTPPTATENYIETVEAEFALLLTRTLTLEPSPAAVATRRAIETATAVAASPMSESDHNATVEAILTQFFHDDVTATAANWTPLQIPDLTEEPPF